MQDKRENTQKQEFKTNKWINAVLVLHNNVVSLNIYIQCLPIGVSQLKAVVNLYCHISPSTHDDSEKFAIISFKRWSPVQS